MLEAYVPVGLFIGLGVLIGCGPVLLGWLLAPSRPDPDKNAPYECGFEPFGDARAQFDVRFYLVAILFVVFDLELAFVFPWAVVMRDVGAKGFGAMVAFLGLLFLGLLYEWRRGALEWE